MLEQERNTTGKNDAMQNAGCYLTSLICEALRGEHYKRKPEGCTWNQIYGLAESNSVEAVSFYGLDKEIVPEELYKKWRQQADTTLFRQVSFDAERETILTQMEEQGISYLPLKGILIVNYYPQPGMRSMSDNDILYGIVEPSSQGGYCLSGKGEKEQDAYVKKAQNQVVEIMTGLGYEIESLKGNHDCYLKEPCFNFEMHRQLMDADSPMYSYYENIWSKAVQEEGNPHAYAFSDEDEYIYFLAHAFKHFDNFGCGIRCAVDQYVFLEKKAEGMNWDYIEGELKKLNLCEFEEQLKNLSYHAFHQGELDDQDKDILFYMLGCGTYGNFRTKVNNSLDRLKEESAADGKGYKLRYWKERFFWPRERCKNYFPFFYKHYWLIWFLPIYRLFRGLFRHPGQLWKEFKNVCKYK